MPAKTDVRQGTLALMILKTLETLGPLHGYGLARRIEQISGDRLSVNYGTAVYPVLLKLEQEGFINNLAVGGYVFNLVLASSRSSRLFRVLFMLL